MKTTHKFLIAVILVSIIGSTSAVSHANIVKNTVEDNLASSDKNDYLLEKKDSPEKIASREVANKHAKDESSSPSAISMARLFVKKNDIAKAIASYEQAINSETDNYEKANYCYELATVIYEQKDYPRVRNLANQAIALKPDWGKPYVLIGKIYAASANLIGESDIQQRLVYCLAVDQFIKAKAVDPEITDEANKEIATYSQYFPNKEDAFFENLKAGSTFKVGGWINESTTVRLR
jgi:tetratricopeptide (TPR) repeat protein